jgi:TonB family protein
MLLNLLLASVAGVSPMTPLPVTWIRPADYPAALLAQGREGTVDFQLTFNPQGRPTACTIAKSSGTPLLDVVTCRLSVRRARAEQGQPRVQYYRQAWKRPTV